MFNGFYLILCFAFILGSVVGSFLNVCIYRIPIGKSIVLPPSSCPHCGHRIRWFQNIPIVSYLCLGGRCSSCQNQISVRYPAIEFLTGSLFCLTFYFFEFSIVTLIYWGFLSALVVITFIDLDHQIIPDIISLPGILIGLVCSFLIPWLTWADSILGILIGGGVLFLIAWMYERLTKKEGMGGGDIKLLAMLGAFMGWKAVLPIIFLASLLGTLIGVPLMFLQGKDTKLAIPFGPFLAFSATICLFWGPRLVGWYLALVI